MRKSYYSLGLMSGTSMDGVDASIIQSNGESKYKVIMDKYFEYPQATYKDLTKLRDKIKSSKDLKNFSKEIKKAEKEITLFHAKAVSQILKKTKTNVDFIGFHGQTIYHNPIEKISKQLGDGNLLSQLTKKTVIYDFRQNDIKNNGEGAPLTPIFHKLLKTKFKIIDMSSFSIFLALILIVCFLLVLVIMVQNPKGGGLSSSFGGDSQQIGGVKKTTDFLDKSTWVLASLLLILILLSNITLDTGNTNSESKLLDSNSIEETIPETLPENIPLEIPVQE